MLQKNFRNEDTVTADDIPARVPIEELAPIVTHQSYMNQRHDKTSEMLFDNQIELQVKEPRVKFKMPD